MELSKEMHEFVEGLLDELEKGIVKIEGDKMDFGYLIAYIEELKNKINYHYEKYEQPETKRHLERLTGIQNEVITKFKDASSM